MGLFIGVDPGTQGAICLLSTGVQQTIKFINTPQSKELSASVKRIFKWLPCSDHINRIAIEAVHSMGGMSAKSNFQFGRNLGFVEIIFSYWFTNTEYITPKIWQKGCGIVFTYPANATAIEKKKIRKVTIAARVLELYPDAEIYGSRGGLKDGRADALMIAHYLALTHEENIHG